MLQDRLILRSAICLQPLTAAQIDRYFEQAGDRLSALQVVLPQDAELQELAKSPLMLSVMSLAYQDFTPEQLTVGGKIEDYRKRLFAAYIDRMFERRGTTQKYSRVDTQRWLIWLAKRMRLKSQTMFLIERIQPSWLPLIWQRIFYRLEIFFIAGLLFDLINWPIQDLRFVLNHLLSRMLGGDWMYIYPISLNNLLLIRIPDQLSTYALIYGIWVGFLGNIKTFENLKWSWQEVRNSLPGGLMIMPIWLPIRVTMKILEQSECLNCEPIDELISGLVGGLMIGLIYSLISGLRGSEIRQGEKPNQGITQSAWNAAIIGGITCLISSIVGVLTIHEIGYENMHVVLICGLMGGGTACIQHFGLRLMLYCNRYIPWNYTRFLNYATERLFLQKVGGGYIFVHRTLLEHFAEMSPEQWKR
jgi:hypothetical protein